MDSAFKYELAVEQLPMMNVYRPSLEMYFEDSFKIKAHHETEFCNGRYLRITLATNCKGCSQSPIVEYGRKMARLVQLNFGLPAASHMTIESTINIENGSSSSLARESYLFPEFIGVGNDHSSITRHINGGSICKIHLSPEVEVLFDAGINAPNPWQRFLFHWLALEAILGPKGLEREQYCLTELNSAEINVEMKRLRDLRVEIVHYGKPKATGNEVVSVLWLLRIALQSSSEVRANMVTKYISWINDNILH